MEEVKLSLFADDMTLYKSTLKTPAKKKKKFELKIELSKVTAYKINAQKLVAFLYTNNNVLGKLRIPWTTASKKIKYLGINLTEVKDLYTETIRHLRKIDEDTSK